jgi:hypothetical protein
MGKNQYETVDEATFSKPEIAEGIAKRFDAVKQRFVNGDRSALFDTLNLCAQFQAVIPDWAADAILQGSTDLQCGDSKDYNELFGWDESHSQRNRRREATIRDNEGAVVRMLIDHRCEDDGSLNAEYTFGKISEQSGLPRRIVEEIYRRHKDTVKSIPQGNPEGINHATFFGALPIFRRYSRSLL